MSNMTYPKITLPQLLGKTAAKWPGRTALIYFGAEISYTQLLDHVNRVAAGLQALGLKKGDRVALLMPNCPQFVISYFGALRAGAIVTATSSMYTAREVTHQWNDAGAKFVIADRRLFPVVKTALPQLNSVRQIVLTGMRQYYPKQWSKLCESLEASGCSGGALRTTRPTSSGRAGCPQRAAQEPTEPAVYTWDDLLRIAREPASVDLTQADI